MADRVGQRLGNYRLVRLLGRGGFAEVYLGEHVFLKTQAAIKVLHMRLTHADLDSFLNEARTIAGLIHPHIVRVLEFGVEGSEFDPERSQFNAEGSTPFLVMDYAANATLRKRHPKGTRLPLPTIVTYMKQVAEAIQYAHEKKLIHRDIKPENMLLGPNNEVLLSDFGIAMIAQSTRYQNTQEVAGTAAYMAPEQLQGKPRRASDQYSLGIVVYEWICGSRPFHGTFTEIYSQQLSVPPSSLREKVPELPSSVEEVVLTALAKQPQQRFSSVQAFATALEQACQTALQDLPDSSSIVSELSGQVAQPKATMSQRSLASQAHISIAYQKTKEQWLTDALAHYEAGRYADALAALEHAIQLDSNFGSAYNAKGLTLYKLERYTDALIALKRAIQLDPDDATAHYGSGLAMEERQRYSEALQAYEKAVQLDANYASAWRKKGDALYSLKRYEDALAAYEHALQLNLNDPDAYIGKGNALKQLGRLK